ncbi:DUF2442 domain-containing protein [Thermus tengchongensis]|uniref:DUF2442 domain-containing protein n=1 Tax=Thermus tengchongensis TaxID=1214928 RepID=UPI001F3CAEB3|nr:DUF2442 domain-containing protein [Thermus tengchongensis]
MRLVRIVKVKPLGDYRLLLGFDDGTEGEVAFSPGEFTGVLEPLRDPAFFAQAHPDPEFGSLAWPGEIELDPLVVYERATGRKVVG